MQTCLYDYWEDDADAEKQQQKKRSIGELPADYS